MSEQPGKARNTLVIATRNAHKVEEIRAILGEGYDYRTLNDFPGAPKTIEDAETFAGNATKKAVELAEWLAAVDKLGEGEEALVLADDSGLEVDALEGAPGVHSARFAALDSNQSAAQAGNSQDAANNAKLLRLLRDVPPTQRTARFRCTLCLTPVLRKQPTGSSPVCAASEAEMQSQLFDGACEGQIAFAPKGEKGFGYDPLFIPAGFQDSFAQLGEHVKNRISHRAAALSKLKEWLNKT